MRKSDLSLGLVHRLLDYNKEDGVFRWREPPNKRVGIGQEAGIIASNGRRYIGLMGEKHLAHRLAWFYVTGAWPVGNIVQENGDYADFRWSNLREEGTVQTVHRGAMRSSNHSGFRGVSWSADKEKWVATITRGYRRLHLGYFDDPKEASAKYEEAAAALPHNIEGSTVPTVDEVAARRRLRKQWRRVLTTNDNKSGWAGIDMFGNDVGEAPSSDHRVVPLDPTRVIGPGNFRWVVPEKKLAKKERGYYREQELRRKLGKEGYARFTRMLELQESVCAICGNPETAMRDGEVKNLAVDHRHDGDLGIRGLLCGNCNPLIGYARDNPDVLRSAVEYIENGGSNWGLDVKDFCVVCKDFIPDGAKLAYAYNFHGMPLGNICEECQDTGEHHERQFHLEKLYRRYNGLSE